MPVLFNCSVCRKRLSVSRRKIGQQVECPACSSYIVVPDEDQPSLPTVEFSEATEYSESPNWSNSEDEELTIQTPPDALELLAETETPRESETPVGDRRVPEESDSGRFPSQEEPIVESAMGSGSVAESTDEAPPIRFRRAVSEFEEMDLTPMVDVTFLLLIFFMITASFTLEKTIPTPVPDPDKQSAAQPIQQQEELLEKSIVIGIESDNTITIDEEPVPKPDLLKRLTDLMSREHKAEALVTVSDLAMQETVVYVLDTANDVGMEKIRLASTPSEAN